MKAKKMKKQKYINNDTKEIRTLIIITLAVVIIAGCLYFLTDKILNKKDEKETKEVTFNYDETIVGMMFNRPYESYYVFLYDKTSENATQYDTLLNNYRDKEDAVKVYYVDMCLKNNSIFFAEKSNPKAKSPEEVKIKDSALILIKNGEILKYYEKISDYEKVLN